jgi:type III pantothenate kinase
MLLAIDAGNTNTVFAVFRDGAIMGEWRLATQSGRTADEFAVWLDSFLALARLERGMISDAVIANVVPASAFALRDLCRRYLKCEPLVIGEPGVMLGISIKVDRPDEVGADRLVNAVGAHERWPGGTIVIDFGTATTFDVVDVDGAYCGGVIAPGIGLSIEALHRAAAKLPRVGVTRPAKVIGTSTVGAMQSGIYWGYVSLIEGLVGRIRVEFGKPLGVIATGGLAPLFDAATDVIDAADPHLTLFGLAAVHRRNRPA